MLLVLQVQAGTCQGKTGPTHPGGRGREGDPAMRHPWCFSPEPVGVNKPGVGNVMARLGRSASLGCVSVRVRACVWVEPLQRRALLPPSGCIALLWPLWAVPRLLQGCLQAPKPHRIYMLLHASLGSPPAALCTYRQSTNDNQPRHATVYVPHRPSSIVPAHRRESRHKRSPASNTRSLFVLVVLVLRHLLPLVLGVVALA